MVEATIGAFGRRYSFDAAAQRLKNSSLGKTGSLIKTSSRKADAHLTLTARSRSAPNRSKGSFATLSASDPIRTNLGHGFKLWSNQPFFTNSLRNYSANKQTNQRAASRKRVTNNMISLPPSYYAGAQLEHYQLAGKAHFNQAIFSQKQSKQRIQSAVQATDIGETAKPASSFVDSIGVNTHIHYYDTSYGNFSLVEQRLKEAGIRHIRDGGSDPTWAERINQLGREGIKSTLVIDPNIGVGPNASYDIKPPGYQLPQLVKDVVPEGAEAVEALNEFDLSYQNGYSRNQQAVTGSDWVNYLRDFTHDLFNNIKSDPATKNVAVIGPSFVYADSSTAIGDLSQTVDYGNMHPYNNPSFPEDGNLDRDMANRSKPFGNLPLIATETGYHTASEASGSVSETVQGKYIPRLFLNNFNHGVYRTFSYELMDQKPEPNHSEANFGLLHTDGSPKPAFTAVKNLIGLLNDTGTFTPRSLDYSISGNTQNLQHTLLQKSNGDFYLVMWLGVPSTDQTTSQQVTVKLNTPVTQATTYAPNQSTDAVAQFSAPTQIDLSVPDSPIVLKLSPQQVEAAHKKAKNMVKKHKMKHNAASKHHKDYHKNHS